MDEVLLSQTSIKVGAETVSLVGSSISLTMLDDHFAIRVNTPAQLGDLGKKTPGLGLSKVTDPIHLLPFKSGILRATFEIPGSGDGELLLEPVKAVER